MSCWVSEGPGRLLPGCPRAQGASYLGVQRPGGILPWCLRTFRFSSHSLPAVCVLLAGFAKLAALCSIPGKCTALLGQPLLRPPGQSSLVAFHLYLFAQQPLQP